MDFERKPGKAITPYFIMGTTLDGYHRVKCNVFVIAKLEKVPYGL